MAEKFSKNKLLVDLDTRAYARLSKSFRVLWRYLIHKVVNLAISNSSWILCSVRVAKIVGVHPRGVSAPENLDSVAEFGASGELSPGQRTQTSPEVLSEYSVCLQEESILSEDR